MDHKPLVGAHLATGDDDAPVGEGLLLADGVWRVFPACGLQFWRDVYSASIGFVHRPYPMMSQRIGNIGYAKRLSCGCLRYEEV